MNMPTDITPRTDFGKGMDMNATQTIAVPKYKNQMLVMAAEAVRAVVSAVFVVVLLFPAALSFVTAGTPAVI
jgi:hypothetical protein